jgi:hypothetical protein
MDSRSLYESADPGLGGGSMTLATYAFGLLILASLAGAAIVPPAVVIFYAMAFAGLFPFLVKRGKA